MAPFQPGKKDSVRVKVLGPALADPLLLHLVSYDTVKTVRGLIANHLRSAGVAPFKSFELFGSFPRKNLAKNSNQSLAEVGLAPSGVIHVSLNISKSEEDQEQET